MPTTQSASQTPRYLQIATFLEIAPHHIWGTFAKNNQDLEVLRAEKISGFSILTPQGLNLQLFPWQVRTVKILRIYWWYR